MEEAAQDEMVTHICKAILQHELAISALRVARGSLYESGAAASTCTASYLDGALEHGSRAQRDAGDARLMLERP